MPDPAPSPLTIPDFRDRSRYPERPSHHQQSYRDDFNVLVKELSRREEPPKITVRPLLDPRLSPQEYEKQYREHVRKLARS
jgi:hypothetical protein